MKIKGEIIQENMIPYFSKGNYSEGILNGVTETAKLVAQCYGKKLFEATDRKISPDKEMVTVFVIILFVLILLILVLCWIITLRRRRSTISKGGKDGNFGGGGGFSGGHGASGSW